MRFLLPIWGAHVQRARKDAGLTQADLAERIGVRQQAISKVENGTVAASDVLKMAVAMALRTDVGSLFPWPPASGATTTKEVPPL